MMTITSAQLSDSLQALIDARLDTIDRMLLGRVPRLDRLAIVREVEAQIHEQLQERETTDLSREDVLAVLGRLDPPEAYLPDEPMTQPGPMRAPSTVSVSRPASVDRSKFARASGVLGLCAVAMILLSPVIYMAAIFTESEALMIGGLFLAIFSIFITGLLAIVLAGVARVKGAWSIAGLASGIISILVAFAGGMFLIMELS